MIFNSLLLAASIFLVIKSAGLAIRYSSRMAESFSLPRYVIGFLIVAVISVLPETFIAVSSAIQGVPEFGLGTLFGGNVADLTLVFALVILISGRNLRVESKVIKNRFFYISIVSLPLLFGLNGYYSRLEGLILVISGLFFYFFILKTNQLKTRVKKVKFSTKNTVLLIASMAVLLLSAQLIVESGVNLAHSVGVNPILIGMFIVGLSTVLPELFFSAKAARSHYDSLALGDILGTVIADATIAVGIVALIAPFSFNLRIIYITGVFMILSLVLLLHFLKTGKALTRKEAFFLLLFYCLFIIAELLINL